MIESVLINPNVIKHRDIETTQIDTEKATTRLSDVFLNIRDRVKDITKPFEAQFIDLPHGSVYWREVVEQRANESFEAEKEYHENLYDYSAEQKYKQKKQELRQAMRADELSSNVPHMESILPDIEKAYHEDEITKYEFDKFKRKVREQRKELNAIPKPSPLKYPKAYDSSIPCSLTTSPAFWLSTLANTTTYISRRNFGFFPFPHYDKISDVAAFGHEPGGYTIMIKKGISNGLEILSKSLLRKHGKELFLFKSFTRAELFASMTWYGGLWITSELPELFPIHPAALLLSTPDKMDIPAYITGMLIQHEMGKQVIKRMPPGRFEDMQRSVANKLKQRKETDKTGGKVTVELLTRSFIGGEGENVAAKRFVKDYKELLGFIKRDLQNKSTDVKGYLGSDESLLKQYDRMIMAMTVAYARQWVFDQIVELKIKVSNEAVTHHQEKLSQKILVSHENAREFRRMQFRKPH